MSNNHHSSIKTTAANAYLQIRQMAQKAAHSICSQRQQRSAQRQRSMKLSAKKGRSSYRL